MSSIGSNNQIPATISNIEITATKEHYRVENGKLFVGDKACVVKNSGVVVRDSESLQKIADSFNKTFVSNREIKDSEKWQLKPDSVAVLQRNPKTKQFEQTAKFTLGAESAASLKGLFKESTKAALSTSTKVDQVATPAIENANTTNSAQQPKDASSIPSAPANNHKPNIFLDDIDDTPPLPPPRDDPTTVDKTAEEVGKPPPPPPREWSRSAPKERLEPSGVQIGGDRQTEDEPIDVAGLSRLLKSTYAPDGALLKPADDVAKSSDASEMQHTSEPEDDQALVKEGLKAFLKPASTTSEHIDNAQEVKTPSQPAQKWSRPASNLEPKEQSTVQMGQGRQNTAESEDDTLDVDRLGSLLKSTYSTTEETAPDAAVTNPTTINEPPNKELAGVAKECRKENTKNRELVDYALDVLQTYQKTNSTPDFGNEIQMLTNLSKSLTEVGDTISKLILEDGKIDAKELSAYLQSKPFDDHMTNLAVMLASFMNINAKLTTKDETTGKIPLDIIKASTKKREDKQNVIDVLHRCNQMLPRFVLQIEKMQKTSSAEQKQDFSDALTTAKSHAATVQVKKSVYELNTVNKLLLACVNSNSTKRISFVRTAPEQRIAFEGGRLVLKPVGITPRTRTAVKESGAGEILNILEAAKKMNVNGDEYNSIISQLESMPDFKKLLTNKDGTPSELGIRLLDLKVPRFGADAMAVLKGIDGSEPEELPAGQDIEAEDAV